jgi:hypothetical protein
LQLPLPMRVAVAVLAVPLVLPLLPGIASACPGTLPHEVSTDESPGTQSPCMRQVDFSTYRSAVDIRYVLGASGANQSSVGTTANAFVVLDLGYGLQFGDEAQPSYEIELSAGAAGQRTGGDVSATGLVTRGTVRVGPAQMAPSVLDEAKGNIAWLPLTWELAHVGELQAQPRLSARPDLSRARYGRERVELATRLVRVEGAGEKKASTAPGLTEVKKPTAWVIDAIALHGGVDATMQNGTRLETTIGGAMLAGGEHTSGLSMEFFGIEHRHYNLPMLGTSNLAVFWALRVDGTNPKTGTQYYAGWGEVIEMPDRDKLAERIDPYEQKLTIGGLGWFFNRGWGGWGLQYKREPFMTMTGAVALEDRVSAEVFVPRALNLVVRAFAASATRLVNDDLRHDSTAGVELDASYTRDGFTSKLGLGFGRSFYTSLDGGLPDRAGAAASVALTVQHAGGRSWPK